MVKCISLLHPKISFIERYVKKYKEIVNSGFEYLKLVVTVLNTLNSLLFAIEMNTTTPLPFKESISSRVVDCLTLFY